MTRPPAEMPTAREIIMRCLSSPKRAIDIVAQGYAPLCKLIEDELTDAGYQISRPAPPAAQELLPLAEAWVEAAFEVGGLRVGFDGPTPESDEKLSSARTAFIAALTPPAPDAERVERVAMRVVDEQAADSGLWFIPQTAPEAYLMQALRRLHAAVEGKSPDECARAALAALEGR